MSKRAVVALDSYRLAQYVVPVPCYVCGQDNNHEAELCCRCAAPMALAHQAAAQRVRPQMVALLGAAASGKTTYLGMAVDILSQGGGPMQMLARGAFSVAIQQTTIGALCQGRFPDVTPAEPHHWNWLHCQIKHARRRKPLELIIPDMSGATIEAEVDRLASSTTVRAYLSRCVGALLLVDAPALRDGERGQDFAAMKLLHYLHELDSRPRKGWPGRPVAVVLTKADQCPEAAADAAGFARRYAAGLMQQCEALLKRHRCFACSVAGTCACYWRHGKPVQVPLRIEPHGIVQPLDWLISQLP